MSRNPSVQIAKPPAHPRAHFAISLETHKPPVSRPYLTMGNSSSTAQGPFADIELTALAQPLVAIDPRFVRPAEITRLKFKEIVLFRTGRDSKLQTLPDGDKQPIVTVATKPETASIYYVYRPETSKQNQSEDSALLQVYVKLGAVTKMAYLDTTLHVDFTDLTTGARCKITMDGEWRSRNAVFWREQTHNQPRTALGRVFPPKSSEFLHESFTLEIAPNVDTARHFSYQFL